MNQLGIKVEGTGNVAVAWKKGRHEYYEDSFRLLHRGIPLVERKKRGELLAVFDGIGSTPRAREAAQKMADALTSFYTEPDNNPASIDGIRHLLNKANASINEWGFAPGKNAPAGGCAGTVAWICKNQLRIFHAGDTSAVLIHDGKPEQLTKAHQDDADTIYNYFGISPSMEMDINQFQLEEDDRVLLVSDGVTKVFSIDDASAIIEKYTDLRRAVNELVEQSRQRGSTDDITALLYEFGDM